MYRDPDVVIEQTIENLKMLAAFFNEEIETRDLEQTPTLHRFREARSTIVSLIPKLNAARQAQISQSLGLHCRNCD